MILKQSFGGEIVRILGRDDAERFKLFLDSGFGTRELAMVLVAGFGVGGGDSADENGVLEFIQNIHAKECEKVFVEYSKEEEADEGVNGACALAKWNNVNSVLPPGPLNGLHEVQLLESTLKTTYNDMVSEAGIIPELITGGAKGLIENVKCIKGEMDECDTEFGREMDLLEGLLERFDRHIDDEIKIDDITSERLIEFRYTVIERNGELVSVDITEQECREKVENIVRFTQGDVPRDIKVVMESLVEAGWKKVTHIKGEIEKLVQEIAGRDEELDQTGLKGALKHYRSLRDEARQMTERNRVIRIHQQRLERELELLDVGFYDRSDLWQGKGAREGGNQERIQTNDEGSAHHPLPAPDVLPPSAVIKEGLDSHVAWMRAQEQVVGENESIWQIFLRLFLGYEPEENEQEENGNNQQEDVFVV